MTNNTSTKGKTMTDAQREEKQIKISDLAEKFLDEAIAKGESFSEGLCSWAVAKAERIVG